MIKRIFLDHPEAVDESYSEHLQQASSFGFRMIGAGIACIIHGLVPCLFKQSGSKAVGDLHETLSSRAAMASKATS